MTAVELVYPGSPQLLMEVDPQTALHCYTPGVSSRTIPGVAAEPVRCSSANYGGAWSMNRVL